MPRALQERERGSETESQVTIRMHTKLLAAVDQYAADLGVDRNWIVVRDLAWLVGVDCIDTFYKIPEAIQAVKERIQAGIPVPTYFDPRARTKAPPAGDPATDEHGPRS
jgi:hypothetical protein